LNKQHQQDLEGKGVHLPARKKVRRPGYLPMVIDPGTEARIPTKSDTGHGILNEEQHANYSFTEEREAQRGYTTCPGHTASRLYCNTSDPRVFFPSATLQRPETEHLLMYLKTVPGRCPPAAVSRDATFHLSPVLRMQGSFPHSTQGVLCTVAEKKCLLFFNLSLLPHSLSGCKLERLDSYF
jgi:hypothetical protein